jgi:hypothetical protein
VILLVCIVLVPTFALPVAAHCGCGDRTLYGIAHIGANPNQLYEIDPETGEATLIGSTGPSVLRISAMAFACGVLYAVGSRNDAAQTHILVTVDLDTGAATEVGPTGLEGFVGVFPQRRVISDMTVSEDGDLFAYAFPGGGLATVDLETGAATQRIPPGFPGTGFHNGGGLAFSPDGVLYHGGDSGNQPGEGAAGLQALDPEDSAVLFELPLLFPVGFGLDPRPNGMDFEPESEVLYSLFKANLMEQATYFGTIDPSTGVATVVGQTVDGMAAFAWGPEDEHGHHHHGHHHHHPCHHHHCHHGQHGHHHGHHHPPPHCHPHH